MIKEESNKTNADKIMDKIIIAIWIFIAIVVLALAIFIAKSQIKYNSMSKTDQIHVQLMNTNEDYIYCPYCGHKLEE